MWILALFRNTILAGCAGIMIGLGFTVAFPAWMALVSSATDPSRRGEVLGAVGMAQGLAAIVGTFLGAIIYHSDALSFPRLGVVNYNVPFWFSAILLSIGTVIAFTWVTNSRAHKDACERITARQRFLVAVAAILGLITLVTWISLRYTRPVAPDRVAWQWVQQLVKGRPHKAVKYAMLHYDGWDGAAASREASNRFHGWKKTKEARYTVRPADWISDHHAQVSVDFILKGNIDVMRVRADVQDPLRGVESLRAARGRDKISEGALKSRITL